MPAVVAATVADAASTPPGVGLRMPVVAGTGAAAPTSAITVSGRGRGELLPRDALRTPSCSGDATLAERGITAWVAAGGTLWDRGWGARLVRLCGLNSSCTSAAPCGTAVAVPLPPRCPIAMGSGSMVSGASSGIASDLAEPCAIPCTRLMSWWVAGDMGRDPPSPPPCDPAACMPVLYCRAMRLVIRGLMGLRG
jgi:hypothetical protein